MIAFAPPFSATVSEAAIQAAEKVADTDLTPDEALELAEQLAHQMSNWPLSSRVPGCIVERYNRALRLAFQDEISPGYREDSRMSLYGEPENSAVAGGLERVAPTAYTGIFRLSHAQRIG